MAIERYDHYSKPRLYVTPTGTYLVRDVLQDDGRFSGVCENGIYTDDGIIWRICKEGEEFTKLTPFLAAGVADVIPDTKTEATA